MEVFNWLTVFMPTLIFLGSKRNAVRWPSPAHFQAMPRLGKSIHRFRLIPDEPSRPYSSVYGSRPVKNVLFIGGYFPVRLPGRLGRVVSRFPVSASLPADGTMQIASCAVPAGFGRLIPGRFIGRLSTFSWPIAFPAKCPLRCYLIPEMLIRVNREITGNPHRMSRKSGKLGNKDLFPNLRLHLTPCAQRNVSNGPETC